MTAPARPCRSCGRTITRRKAWADDFDAIRYCSAACRRRKVRPVDRALEQAILDLLDQRAGGATICPSEAARMIAGPDADEAAWQELREPARRAARRLVHRDEVVIIQQGRVVDPSTAKGPIRIRRRT